jgi:MerR family transcriptional regulator/heat shock protein HspR
MTDMFDREEPVFIISVAARMLGVRTQTLRYYESLGLLEPARTDGNQRVYSRRDIEKVQRIRALMEDLGVNLAGVEVIIKLMQRVEAAEREIEHLTRENEQLRILPAGQGAGPRASR